MPARERFRLYAGIFGAYEGITLPEKNQFSLAEDYEKVNKLSVETADYAFIQFDDDTDEYRCDGLDGEKWTFVKAEPNKTELQ